MSETWRLADYPLRSYDKLRYGDTDRQGHVNNAVYSTLFETGRMDLLVGERAPAWPPATAFVIARVAIDFIQEVLWPGTIDIGTRVVAVGRSSIRLEQTLFQGEARVAAAESVLVLIDETTRRSCPLPPDGMAYFSGLIG